MIFRTSFRFSLAVGVFTVGIITAVSVFAEPLELQSTSAYSRLKVTVDSSFSPKITQTKTGFEIQIPAATLMDLGIPFGGEADFQSSINAIKDQRLKNLQVKELSNSVLIKGEYTFPKGKDELANPKMEFFEFRQAETGRWVIDFWYQKGPTLVQKSKNEKALELKKKHQEELDLIKKDADRKAARDKRLEESQMASQFCSQPMDRKNTVFLRFRPDHPRLNFATYFPEHIPDHRFEYTEPKGDTEEAQMVKLALKLSRENKHALVVRTIDFLEKEYPKSTYLDEMKFLKASAHYRLGLEDQGRELIMSLAKSARGTEAGLQASAFIAVQSFRKEEWLTALESFMNIRREFPKHPLSWLFRFGIAECLYEIKQSEQAQAEYEWVAKNAPKATIRLEAAFKVGDIYFDRNQFAQAIQSYNAAIKKNSDMLAQYPSVVLNLAESYFQLEELERAQKEYERFLDVGRAQVNAWRAHLRLAELKSFHQVPNAETEAAFTDTVNRYPMTPGAVIARLRLLPCGHHGGFDPLSAERFFKSPEVARFDQVGELYSNTFHELVSLTEVRTWISFNLDAKAVDRAMDRLRENPSFEVRKLIEQAMIGGVKRLLDGQVKANDFVQALATFEKYGDYLPLPNHDPMVDDLRLKLAKYASEMKFTNLALKIVEPYRRMSDIQQKDLLAAIERNLTLESVVEQEERAYIEAKTRWNGQTFKFDDEKSTNEFINLLAAIREISPHAWDRDLMKALLYQERKEYGKAFDLAFKLTKKISVLKPGAQAQVWAWFADLALKADQNAEAIRGFQNAKLLAQKLPENDRAELAFQYLPHCPSVSTLVFTEGEMLEKEQKWKEAIALYSDAIENKIGGNHILFAHARAILKEGGRDSKKLASRSLEKIQQSQDDDVWKSLAQKALDEIAKEGKNDQSAKPRTVE